FCYFIMSNGLPSTDPVVGEVMPDSAAYVAGVKAGDRIYQINNTPMKRFNDIPMFIATNLGEPIMLHVERGSEKLQITLAPKEVEDDDGLGNKIKRPLI